MFDYNIINTLKWDFDIPDDISHIEELLNFSRAEDMLG